MSNLLDVDTDIFNAIKQETNRQNDWVELIASENFVSKAVLEAQGSVMTNKYAEGYPGKRYYSGCEYVDVAESLAIERAKKLFNCSYVNVQPHSGCNANLTVFFALLQPGDKILGMALDGGGHLTHGSAPSLSGKWFDPVQYTVDPKTYLIDYDQVESLAKEHKPKIIIAGYSAYSRKIDFKRFREIADKVGAYLLVDMAHFAGLVATGFHESPIEHAHVVTSTTHKTLRGPRGGIILSNDEDLGKKFNSALFPGIQGGPLMHVIAAKAVAFKEALDPKFKEYISQVIKNATALSARLQEKGYPSLTEGSDNHLLLIDLRKHNITGKAAADSLDRAGITCNKNSVPFDTTSPFITSGLRLGTSACTSRGFKEKEFEQVADLISEVLQGLIHNSEDNTIIEQKVKAKILKLCSNFKLPY
jgi:glycine hydroxymethyltransferase